MFEQANEILYLKGIRIGTITAVYFPKYMGDFKL
jgi:hypothetical protein